MARLAAIQLRALHADDHTSFMTSKMTFLTALAALAGSSLVVGLGPRAALMRTRLQPAEVYDKVCREENLQLRLVVKFRASPLISLPRRRRRQEWTSNRPRGAAEHGCVGPQSMGSTSDSTGTASRRASSSPLSRILPRSPAPPISGPTDSRTGRMRPASAFGRFSRRLVQSGRRLSSGRSGCLAVHNPT